MKLNGRILFYTTSFLALAAIGALSLVADWALWLLVVVGPLILLGIHDIVQKRHTLLRIYPVIGHGRYLMEAIRPEINQYFVESNTDGRPFNRTQRSIIYQRAKGDMETLPFGTQHDVYEVGYEWIAHSMRPLAPKADEPRVLVGGPSCTRPYSASRLNVSAMSYGSLGSNAILALNRGAKLGGFAHNTGEGGVSPYHLEGGGDLVWQIGTGYFGCRTPEGKFDPAMFRDRAATAAVKMIEIKLSQGAKPAHGGILPARKVSREIAEIRGVPLGRDVISPPAHATFATPVELLEWISELRRLADGKPVGIKLCVGRRREFLALCKAMVETGLTPDFITVDGGEGGTGAAPLEFSDTVGMPFCEALVFVQDALRGIGVRDRVRIVASGKIVTGFDMFRAMALGADLCNSARGMMFALGCIQARRCNRNDCPVGVATTDPGRARTLDVEDKGERVAGFQKRTVRAFLELLAAAGLERPEDIRPEHVMRRIDTAHVRSFEDLYGFIEPGSLLGEEPPAAWSRDWQSASAERF